MHSFDCVFYQRCIPASIAAPDPGCSGPQTLWVKGGSLVQLVWRAIRPLVKPDQRQKLRIVSAKEEPGLLAAFASPDQMEPRFAGGAMAGYAYDAGAFLDALLAFPGVQAPDRPPLGGWGAGAAAPLAPAGGGMGGGSAVHLQLI